MFISQGGEQAGLCSADLSMCFGCCGDVREQLAGLTPRHAPVHQHFVQQRGRFGHLIAPHDLDVNLLFSSQHPIMVTIQAAFT